METIEINGTAIQVPDGAIAYKLTDPTGVARWIFERRDAEDVEAEDSSLIVWSPAEFAPTHLLDGEPVMVIDEGTDDGSSGAYTAREYALDEWPQVRVMADGRWLDFSSGDPEDVTHRVEPIGRPAEA